MAPVAAGNTLRVRAVLATKDATLHGKKLSDLIKENGNIAIDVFEEIDGIIVISDIIDLTLAK